MASGQWSKVGEASCRGVYIEPRFPERQCLHLQGTRYWSAAVELLRAGNQERRSHSHLTGVVIAGDFHSCRLSDTSFRSIQASGLSRRAQSLEVSTVASARLRPLLVQRKQGDTKAKAEAGYRYADDKISREDVLARHTSAAQTRCTGSGAGQTFADVEAYSV